MNYVTVYLGRPRGEGNPDKARNKLEIVPVVSAPTSEVLNVCEAKTKYHSVMFCDRVEVDSRGLI